MPRRGVKFNKHALLHSLLLSTTPPTPNNSQSTHHYLTNPMEPEQRGDDIECIAVDPGLVHHGICRLRFHGYKYTKEGTQWVKTPQFTILAWELWDLKRKLRYSISTDGEWRIVTDKYENRGKCVDELHRMNHNLRGIVASAQWIFERDAQGKLVPLVSELQGAALKGGELDVFVVAHLLACEVYETDRRTSSSNERPIVNKARKYGIPSDGKLKYDERKRKAVEVARKLLTQVGKQEALTYLDLVWSAQKRDRPGTPQEHDLCDAFLLAMQYCTDAWEERERGRDNARPVADDAPEPIECITLFDSEEDADLKPRQKRRQPGEARTPKKARKPAAEAKTPRKAKPAAPRKKAPGEAKTATKKRKTECK